MLRHTVRAFADRNGHRIPRPSKELRDQPSQDRCCPTSIGLPTYPELRATAAVDRLAAYTGYGLQHCDWPMYSCRSVTETDSGLRVQGSQPWAATGATPGMRLTASEAESASWHV